MIVERFEQIVNRYRDKVAVKEPGKNLTYGQLNRIADAAARTILWKCPAPGPEPGQHGAALLFENSIDAVVAILAVLKAGQIYIPFDCTYPQNRLEYMLENSGAHMILTNNRHIELAEKLAAAARQKSARDITIINLDAPDEKKNSHKNLTINLSKSLPNKKFCGGPGGGFSKEPPGRRRLNSTTLIPGDPLAYILYTSGSTGKPKGVVQTCRNVLFFTVNYINSLSITSRDRLTFISSFSHDGAVQDIYASLLSGASLYAFDIKQQLPRDIIGKFTEEKITLYHSVPSILRYFLGALRGKERFPWLRLIVTGGETLHRADIEKVCRLFPGAQLAHMYGQTESSVNTMGFIDTRQENADITIGQPLEGIRLLLLNQEGEEVEEFETGEIFVVSDHVALGYQKAPELTAKAFIKDENLGRLYRTGDLGEIDYDGSIRFIGRKDRQVKIRGYRIEPGEIENQLLKHENIKEAVVISKTNDIGEPLLCAYFVPGPVKKTGPGKTPESKELREYLSLALPDYMIPSYFVPIEKLPLAATGKIDRDALPEPGIEDMAAEQYQPPRNEVEKKLIEIWSELLEIDKKKLGVNVNFFQLGGHSLKASILVSRIHKELGTKIPLGEIFTTNTIRGLNNYIKRVDRSVYSPIKAVEKREFYLLSSAQKRLFFLDHFENVGASYNMTNILQVKWDIDKKQFESTIKALIRRHESLRTAFYVVDNEPVQRIHDADKIEFEIQYHDLYGTRVEVKVEENEGTGGLAPMSEDYPTGSSQPAAALISSFLRPFDLATAPLLRVGLARLANEKYLLLFDMHHIISDGTSKGILADDFIRAYEGEALACLEIQYKDFALWQNTLIKTDKLKAQEEYWLNIYKDPRDIPRLNLPLDYQRPAVFDFQGAGYEFQPASKDMKEFRQLGAAQGITIFMNLLTAFNVLLYKYTGQEDIIVGSGIMGRPHADLQGIIGMFVNSLALRNFPHPQKTYRQFLEEVKKKSLQAFENQDVQFEDLVDKVNPQRDSSRHPIFDVMFVVQNFQGAKKVIKNAVFSPYEHGNKPSKFDLILYANENNSDNVIDFRVEYRTSLFRAETIQRLALHFINVIRQAAQDPDITIGETDILSPQEKQYLVFDLNQTSVDYPQNKTIDELFAIQVERMPDNTALVGENSKFQTPNSKHRAPFGQINAFHEGHLTYKDLDKRSRRLARELCDKGVEPDTIVALMLDRCVEMVIGILGILKAGGAYMPIDPDYPQERIRYMLADSSAKILLNDNAVEPGKSEIRISKSEINTNDQNPNDQNKVSTPIVLNFRGSARRAVSSSSLAYVIYTSGSTGRPKGAAVEHRNVVHLVTSLRQRIYSKHTPKGNRLNICMVSPYIFDASVKQIFAALLLGHTLYIAAEKTRRDGDALLAFYQRHCIQISDGTPSHLCILLEAGPPPPRPVKLNLENFLIGGEALPKRLAEDILNRFPTVKITNVYGPTECTVDTTSYETDIENVSQLTTNTVPIGLPIANTFVYLLDLRLRPVPIGGCGEIFIGGEGRCPGYLNRPELTMEKFISSPFIASDRLYRTGDRARRLPDGNIEFLSRGDDQVKIRGFRIELGEIENRLMTHNTVKRALIAVKTDEKQAQYLCAYIVCKQEYAGSVAVSELKDYLSGYLPDYMLPSHIAFLENIPLTPNGKVDRKALTGPGAKSPAHGHIPPGNEIEKKLTVLWGQILKIEAKTIGITDNFFELGGHSLRVTLLISKIHKEFHIKIPMLEIFKNPTIQGSAQYIGKQAVKDRYAFIKATENKEFYALASAQKRLFILQQVYKESKGYNTTSAIILEGDIQSKILEETFEKLIKRHESLRTSFLFHRGEPVQKVHHRVEFNIECYDMKDIEDKEQTTGCGPGTHLFSPDVLHHLSSDFIRPFDLSRPPLLRVGLIKINEKKHLLIIDMHHIISDGVSHTILAKDFIKLYGGQPLPGIPIQYKDFSEWQQRMLETGSGSIKAQEKYWLKEFEGKIHEPELPLDFQRPPIKRFQGKTVKFVIDKELTGKLKESIRQTGTTLSMMLLAVYHILLYKYTRQEDIVIGMPVTGRRHADLQDIVGMFVNMLAIRNKSRGGKIFAAFLSEVKQKVLDALENQDYQFEELVKNLGLERDIGRNPLINVVFDMVNIDMDTEAAGLTRDGLNLDVTSCELEHKGAVFDLILMAGEGNDTIDLQLVYATALFQTATIKKMTQRYLDILEQVLEDNEIKLEDIKISHELKTVKSNIFERKSEFGF